MMLGVPPKGLKPVSYRTQVPGWAVRADAGLTALPWFVEGPCPSTPGPAGTPGPPLPRPRGQPASRKCSESCRPTCLLPGSQGARAGPAPFKGDGGRGDKQGRERMRERERQGERGRDYLKTKCELKSLSGRNIF